MTHHRPSHLVESLESRQLLSAAVDLRAALGSIPNGGTIIPGETIRVPLTLYNDGAAPVSGSLGMDLHVSADANFDKSADPLIGTLVTKIRVPAGSSQTINISVPIPATAPAGTYTVFVDLDPLNAIAETNESNNVTAAQPVTIEWKFGAVPGRTKPAKLRLQDADGSIATFSLSGKGTGEIIASGGGWNLALANTDATSAVGIAVTAGRVDLANISLGLAKSFVAPAVNLTGALVSAGSLATLTLADISAGSTITLAGAAGLKFTAGRITSLALASTGPIKSLRAVDWQRSGVVASSITSPALASLQITGNAAAGVAGNFCADLTLTGSPASRSALTAATIAGTLDDCTWSIDGAVGKIQPRDLGATFHANVSGILASITTKGDFRGDLAAASITKLTIAGNLDHAQILAGADLGSDAALGGSAGAADSFSPGTIGAISVSGTISNSTILAGVHPYDGAFNDLNDVPLTGGAIKTIRASAIDAGSHLGAAAMPATATIGALRVMTASDGRFGQSAYALTSAGVTDATGTVTFTINGQSHSYQFLDEATQLPITDAPVSLAVDVDTFSFGVITLLALGKTVPLQFISLSGTAEPLAPQPALSLQALAVAAAPVPVPVSVSVATDVSTKSILDVGTPWLTKLAFGNVADAEREAINSKVGILASAFVSLTSIGLQCLDNVSHGASTDFLAKIPGVESKVMPAEQAQAEIVADRLVDVQGTIIYSTMMKKLDPLAPVATAIDLAADGVAWGTCNSANNLPNMGVRVTAIGPLKIISYAPISTWDRMASDGTILARVPDAADAANGFIEYISRSNPGEAFVSVLDSAGNATTSVPVGDYFAIAHAPGHSATTAPITASSGNNPLDLVLNPAPVPGLKISPTTSLHTSEDGTTASFTVALNTAPTANVTLTFTNADPTEIKISKTSLVFTPANWATPQTIIVTGVNDSIVDGNITCQVIADSSSSADVTYRNRDAEVITVINADNEASPTPIISLDSMVVAERYTQSYDGGMFTGIVVEERYRVTVTGTVNGPVNTYIYTAPGSIHGSFVMTSWTGWIVGAYPHRAEGDPASTTFTFDVYTDWVNVNSGTLPLTVRVDAYYGDVDPYIMVSDTKTISFT